MQKFASAAQGRPETAPGIDLQISGAVVRLSGLPGGRLNMKPETKPWGSAAADAADRRDLEEGRNSKTDSGQRGETGVEMTAVGEEIAPVRGVGAAQVEHQVISVRRQDTRRLDIFSDDLITALRRGALPSVGVDDIYSERTAMPRFAEPRRDHSRAVIRQAVMHDDGFVLRQAEQARRRISVRGIERYRAYFDGAEPEAGEPGNPRSVLVEPRRQADRIGQAKSRDIDFQPSVRLRAHCAHDRRGPSRTARRADRYAMRPLGIEAKRQRPDEA